MIGRRALWWIVAVAVVVATYLTWRWYNPIAWTAQNSLVRVAPPALSDFGDALTLQQALTRNIDALRKLPSTYSFQFGARKVTHQEMMRTLTLFHSVAIDAASSPDSWEKIAHAFEFYTPAPGETLVTGYYLARLKGSRTPSIEYSVPLYRLPSDLVTFSPSQFFGSKCPSCPALARGRLTDNQKVVPYFSRDEIEFEGALAGKGLELAWVQDRVEAFFLHIQGSGEIALETGETLRVSPAGANGQPYKAIGGVLAAEGSIPKEKVSMQSIKEYLAAHPERLREILSANPSFIFYTEVPEGARGTLGVPVTPFRSVATDYTLFPRGALMFLDTELPGKHPDSERFRGFVFNQDTGGAIKGPTRLDLFVGPGEDAEFVSGHLKHRGSTYFLVVKEEFVDKDPW